MKEKYPYIAGIIFVWMLVAYVMFHWIMKTDRWMEQPVFNAWALVVLVLGAAGFTIYAKGELDK